MRSTWLGLAFTRFRYLTDFQENDKCNSSFVTILHDTQVKYCRLDDRWFNSVYKQIFLANKND